MPAPNKPNTVNATAISIAKRQQTVFDRKAGELRAGGFTVTPPLSATGRPIRLSDIGHIDRDQREWTVISVDQDGIAEALSRGVENITFPTSQFRHRD